MDVGCSVHSAGVQNTQCGVQGAVGTGCSVHNAGMQETQCGCRVQRLIADSPYLSHPLPPSSSPVTVPPPAPAPGCSCALKGVTSPL